MVSASQWGWYVLQCVYADMRGNVLVHAKVPALGLHAIQWAVISWATAQKQRETVYDAKYFYRWPLTLRGLLPFCSPSGRSV